MCEQFRRVDDFAACRVIEENFISKIFQGWCFCFVYSSERRAIRATLRKTFRLMYFRMGPGKRPTMLSATEVAKLKAQPVCTLLKR